MSLKKEDLALTLAQQLRAVTAERQAASREPALKAVRTALKTYQASRLALTHADLLAAADTRDAARFFLHELYGNDETSQRDADLERIVPTMQRILPPQPLHTITQAIVLDALSERLDTAMARTLGPAFTAQDYATAYRNTCRADRDSQLILIKALGDSLADLVRIPFLSVTLGLMRGPARLAGLGRLQDFLEQGFGSFRKVRDPGRFVALIVSRERMLLEQFFRDVTLVAAPDVAGTPVPASSLA